MLKHIPTAFYEFIMLLWRRMRKFCRGARVPHQQLPCLPIPSGIWLQPDAYLYSQQYLMSLGIGVTWDNPDVTLTDILGNVVGSHNLKPSTKYQINALIHNKSNVAPAPQMPVVFTLLSFGAGMNPQQKIGITKVDLPVRTAPGEPVIATAIWTTPSTPGHYCIEIEAVWPGDANPLDNIGQHNTVIQKVSAGQHIIIPVPVMNTLQGKTRLNVKMDSYVLPREPLLRNSANKFARPGREINKTGIESDDAFLSRVINENLPGKFPAAPEWLPALSVENLEIETDQVATVTFEATVPFAAISGEEQRFNISISGEGTDRMIGGVTIIFQIT